MYRARQPDPQAPAHIGTALCPHCRGAQLPVDEWSRSESVFELVFQAPVDASVGRNVTVEGRLVRMDAGQDVRPEGRSVARVQHSIRQTVAAQRDLAIILTALAARPARRRTPPDRRRRRPLVDDGAVSHVKGKGGKERSVPIEAEIAAGDRRREHPNAMVPQVPARRVPGNPSVPVHPFLPGQIRPPRLPVSPASVNSCPVQAIAGLQTRTVS